MAADVGEATWAEVWRDVATQLKVHRAAGRRHLLTEDTVRMCTVMALEAVGVAPGDVGVEISDPALGGGKMDLVVSRPQGRSVVELKYPRGSPSGISPDAMTLGELLRDFLRVAVVPAEDRWVVLVLEPNLRHYLARRGAPAWVDEPGQEFLLERKMLEALPKTARGAIGPTEWLLPVRAHCVVAVPVDVDLALFAYRVEEPAADAIPTSLAGSTAVASAAATSGTRPTAQSGTARAQILTVIQTMVSRSGQPEVTAQQVVDEMRRIGSPYTDSTVRTMLTSHMCAQVHGPNIGSYDDVDRIDRGTYRLRDTAL